MNDINTILVGLFPGPIEPKRINPFLDPVVDELLLLWKGVSLTVETLTSCSVRAALLCDIPATRKVCGFKAQLGCSKCLKVFPCDGLRIVLIILAMSVTNGD